ncbi:MAG: 1-acyl-sn-glycerol-3-phosphate acyltransferase [Deltaproteobacteria bacterium]|nr:1-acyl-sn-glycerol-3-phosphate acyltransferase [Deltaproteobacteria bacterium]
MLQPLMTTAAAQALPPDATVAAEAAPATSSFVRERHLGPARVVEGRRLSTPSAALRIVFAVCVYAVLAPIVLAALLLCLPWRSARIKIGNLTGHVTGGLALWLTGSSFHLRGAEHLDPRRPAIYVGNHSSILDIVLGIWFAPVGTVAVAKKEIVFYPFFGQYYWLAGHVRIDRKSPRRALTSLRELAALVKKRRLSVFIWPEGTRSPDGRMRSFKRGAFHLALETRLPIVPIAIAGAHKAWPPKAVRLTRTNVEITCLPPIDTSAWTPQTLTRHVREIEEQIAAALPPEQRPLPAA